MTIGGLVEEEAEACPFLYEAAVSPHLAAQLNDDPIDLDVVEKDFHRALAAHDYIAMEGSGGIICPLRWDKKEHIILDDLVKRLGLGALVVADAGLGAINAAVLTVEHLRARGIPVRGIILNRFCEGDIMKEDNYDMIEAITGVKIVATVQTGDEALDIDADALAALFE